MLPGWEFDQVSKVTKLLVSLTKVHYAGPSYTEEVLKDKQFRALGDFWTWDGEKSMGYCLRCICVSICFVFVFHQGVEGRHYLAGVPCFLHALRLYVSKLRIQMRFAL